MEYGNGVKKCTVLNEELLIFSKTGEIITIEKPDECGTTENKSTTFTLLTTDKKTEKLILPYGVNLKIGKKIAVVYISNRKNIKQQLLIVDIEFGSIIKISDSEKLVDHLVSNEESRHVLLEFMFGMALISYWLIKIYQEYAAGYSIINISSYSLSLFLLSMVMFFTKIDFKNKKLKYNFILHRTIGDIVERLKCPILCKIKLPNH